MVAYSLKKYDNNTKKKSNFHPKDDLEWRVEMKNVLEVDKLHQKIIKRPKPFQKYKVYESMWIVPKLI